MLQNTFFREHIGELLLYTVLNIEVINVEVVQKQVKKPCLTLNVIFASPEAVIVVDKTRKRSGVYMRLWYLNCNLWSGRHTSLVA